MQHGEARTDRGPWFDDRLFSINLVYSHNSNIINARFDTQSSITQMSE